MALNGISKVLNLVETAWLRLSTDMIKSSGLRIMSRKPTASIYKINQLYRFIGSVILIYWKGKVLSTLYPYGHVRLTHREGSDNILN